MSINSLLSNPTILNELVTIVNDYIPPSGTGINSLINVDGNVNDGVIGTVGNIDLENDITITGLTTDNSKAPNIYNDNDIILSKDTTSLNIKSNEISFNVGNSVFSLDDANLTFSNLSLVTNSMKNIFSTDGSNNQVLQTDGNNNLSWVDLSLGAGGIKYITHSQIQFAVAQGSPSLEIFREIVGGFTVGATSLIELDFTFYFTAAVSSGVSINITVNGDPYTVNTFVSSSNVHYYRGFTIDVVNTGESQEIVIDLGSPGVTFYVDTSDYLTLLITETNN
jgi:hypothetical protein